MRATVIVLGDLGRSPRMQYHALALAANDVLVDLVGEAGEDLPARLQHPRIQVHRLPPHRGIAGVLGAAMALLRVCRRLPRPDVILVQTPPAVPTILVAWVVARWRGSRLILDWHNLGWTILATRRRSGHPVVRLARLLERATAGLADAHLAVSEALARHLRTAWHLRPVQVFRDRPEASFGRALADDAMRAVIVRRAGLPDGTRPAIALSPTSWTADESLDMTLAAADALEDLWRDAGPAAGLVIALSGRGQGQHAFEDRLRARQGRRVHVVTCWAPADTYPALVASADVGLSLHASSSGLDLPMKICDLFGTARPVLALDYGPTLRELVVPDVNTMLFRDSDALAHALDELFGTWPAPSDRWSRLQMGAAAVAAGPQWEDGWQQEARPVILATRPPRS